MLQLPSGTTTGLAKSAAASIGSSLTMLLFAQESAIVIMASGKNP